MAAEVNMQKATSVYKTLIKMLDNKGWDYDKFDEDLVIKSGVTGDDFPIEFIVAVNPKQEVVQFMSRLPGTFPEDKRIDGAIAVCVANYGLCDGSFDYNIATGEITFRLTSSYRESLLSEELFEYMIMVSAGTVDNYNDKFLMMMKGMMSIQQFIEQENS